MLNFNSNMEQMHFLYCIYIEVLRNCVVPQNIAIWHYKWVLDTKVWSSE